MLELEKDLILKLKRNDAKLKNHLYVADYIIESSLSGAIILRGVIGVLLMIIGIMSIRINNTILTNIISMSLGIELLYLAFSLSIVRHVVERISMGDDKLKWSVSVFDKITKVWFLNSRVITRKDWRSVRKKCEEDYKYFRSVNSSGHCYDVTFSIANFIKNKNIKIIWLLCDLEKEGKFGHAVLEKNGYVYDPNLRRTYKLKKYIKYTRGKIYRVFSFDDYFTLASVGMSGDERVFKHFDKEWNEFKEFCKVNGGIRDSSDKY